MMLIFTLMIVTLLTFSGAHLIKRYAHALSLVDVPTYRSSHRLPTPRGGGIAFAFAFCFGLLCLAVEVSLLWLPIFLMGLVLMVSLGFWDDIASLPAKVRFLTQVVAVAVLMWCSGGLAPTAVGHFVLGQGIFYQALALIGLVWLINLYNFMDGIDGLAVVEALSVAINGVILLWWSMPDSSSIWMFLLMMACMSGFLPLNWAPAKLFMGDAGSYFLGYLLVYLILVTTHENELSLWTWFILLGYFIVDATYTLLRRLFLGQRVYQGHRSHLYQILSRRWQSHAKMSLLVLIINLAWLLPMALVCQIQGTFGILWTVIAWLPIFALCVYGGAGKE